MEKEKETRSVHFDEKSKVLILTKAGLDQEDAKAISKLLDHYTFEMLDSLVAGVERIAEGLC